MRACRVGAETLLKVYGVKVDPEEFSAFAGMGEVRLTAVVCPSWTHHSHMSIHSHAEPAELPPITLGSGVA